MSIITNNSWAIFSSSISFAFQNIKRTFLGVCISMLVMPLGFAAVGDTNPIDDGVGDSVTIGVYFDFPPFSPSSPEGDPLALNADLSKYGITSLYAIGVCLSSDQINCTLRETAFSECFTSDGGGNAIVGGFLNQGGFNGCMDWIDTPTRRALGIGFGSPYHYTEDPVVGSLDGSPLQDGDTVGFFSGLFNDEACLEKSLGINVVPTEAVSGQTNFIFFAGAVPDPGYTIVENVSAATCGGNANGLAVKLGTDDAQTLLNSWNGGLSGFLQKNDDELKEVVFKSSPKVTLLDVKTALLAICKDSGTDTNPLCVDFIRADNEKNSVKRCVRKNTKQCVSKKQHKCKHKYGYEKKQCMKHVSHICKKKALKKCKK